MLVIKTNLGEIKIELDEEKTPKTAKNFLRYVNEGFFNGTLFHRVIKGFMIQGGALLSDMSRQKGAHEPIQNEADLGGKNVRGSIAMARTNDPHSATSQFFINLVDNNFLNYRQKSNDGWGYCVFGKVVDGMNVVDKIADVKTTSLRGYQDVPVDDVVIESVEVVK